MPKTRQKYLDEERTSLARVRTNLAYVRTVAALLILIMAFIHFFII